MEQIDDRICQIYEVPLTGNDHFEQESMPSPDNSHGQQNLAVSGTKM